MRSTPCRTSLALLRLSSASAQLAGAISTSAERHGASPAPVLLARAYSRTPSPALDPKLQHLHGCWLRVSA
eukprot:scaffold7523_cov132-Isochrysis_galbana.AAC.2